MEVVPCFSLPIVVLLVFIFIGIYASYETEQRKNIGWRQFSQANGLTFVPGQFFTGPSCYITGKYQDCSLALRAVQQGSGKSRRTYTHLELSRRNHQKIKLASAQF